jgi:hypothetical protein
MGQHKPPHHGLLPGTDASGTAASVIARLHMPTLSVQSQPPTYRSLSDRETLGDLLIRQAPSKVSLHDPSP